MTKKKFNWKGLLGATLAVGAACALVFSGAWWTFDYVARMFTTYRGLQILWSVLVLGLFVKLMYSLNEK